MPYLEIEQPKMKITLVFLTCIAGCCYGQMDKDSIRDNAFIVTHNDWTNGLRGMKGSQLVDFLNSGVHQDGYEMEKAQVFYALQQLGTNAAIYLNEMLQLSRLDLAPTEVSGMNSLARDTLITIGCAAAVPVARQMSISENQFWSGQEILMALKADAFSAVPVLREMRDKKQLPPGRTEKDISNILAVLGDE